MSYRLKSSHLSRTDVLKDAARTVAAAGALTVAVLTVSTAPASAQTGGPSTTPFSQICDAAKNPKTHITPLTPAQVTAAQAQIQSDINSLPGYVSSNFHIQQGVEALSSNPATAAIDFNSAYQYDLKAYWASSASTSASGSVQLGDAINKTLELLSQQSIVQVCSSLQGTSNNYQHPTIPSISTGTKLHKDFDHTVQLLEQAIGVVVVTGVVVGGSYLLYKTRKRYVNWRNERTAAKARAKAKRKAEKKGEEYVEPEETTPAKKAPKKVSRTQRVVENAAAAFVANVTKPLAQRARDAYNSKRHGNDTEQN